MLQPIGTAIDGDNRLTVVLETELPAFLAVGKGNSFYVVGYCFHSRLPIDALDVVVGDLVGPTSIYSIDSSDVTRKQSDDGENAQLAPRSRFWALIKIPEINLEVEHAVLLRVTLNDRSQFDHEIGRIRLTPALSFDGGGWGRTLRREGGKQPLISICMATHNPPIELFKRQIESIRSQTHANWVCLISDDASDPTIMGRMKEIVGQDERFVLFSFPERLGFYNNFERALWLAPRESAYIALSDQDDRWYPEKLEKLIGQFDPQTMLVYSDMRIVSASGEVVSDTFWTTRTNNRGDFCSLVLANAVTGAASLFRRELLEECLPFPFRVGNLFHDHWIGVMAMASGKVKYIDEPLYEYVQHGSNVIGHASSVSIGELTTVRSILRTMRWADGRLLARKIYQTDVVRTQALASTALMRCGNRIEREKRNVLARLAGLDSSISKLVWLLIRGFRDRKRQSVTLGAEYHLGLGLMWKHYIQWKSKLKHVYVIGTLLRRARA